MNYTKLYEQLGDFSERFYNVYDLSTAESHILNVWTQAGRNVAKVLNEKWEPEKELKVGFVITQTDGLFTFMTSNLEDDAMIEAYMLLMDTELSKFEETGTKLTQSFLDGGDRLVKQKTRQGEWIN